MGGEEDGLEGATLRRLGPGDAEAYAAIRREMLVDSPWSFLGCPGDDRPSDAEWIRGRLGEDDNAVFGAFGSDGLLLSVSGVHRSMRVKTAHRASVWGVYTRPAARGRGLARLTVQACIDHARSWGGVGSVGLSVSERSPGARRLYESLGFVWWGREPGAIGIGGELSAEDHLLLWL